MVTRLTGITGYDWIPWMSLGTHLHSRRWLVVLVPQSGAALWSPERPTTVRGQDPAQRLPPTTSIISIITRHRKNSLVLLVNHEYYGPRITNDHTMYYLLCTGPWVLINTYYLLSGTVMVLQWKDKATLVPSR
jgi:hypothetical protein